MSRLQPFWLAMALLTTLPVGGLIRAPITATDQGRSVVCYPLVGLLIGGLLALLAWPLAHAPAPLGAMLLLVAWVTLSGALHLDGLADCSDAWFAGHADPGRTLDVMKDPSAGPVAVTVLVLLLLLKLAALLAVGTASPALLLAAPVFGRGAAVVLMLTTDYRRREGIAGDQAAYLPKGAAAAVVAVLLVAGVWVLPLAVWFALVLATALCTLGWRHAWRRRIGGYTGDIVGGLIECVEAAVLVVAALVMGWV